MTGFSIFLFDFMNLYLGLDFLLWHPEEPLGLRDGSLLSPSSVSPPLFAPDEDDELKLKSVAFPEEDLGLLSVVGGVMTTATVAVAAAAAAALSISD